MLLLNHKNYKYGELCRGVLSVMISKSPYVMDHCEALYYWKSHNWFVQSTKNFVVRNLFYKHFCGGENLRRLENTVRHLEKANIHSILDYAAETPMDSNQKVDYNETVHRNQRMMHHSVDKFRVPMVAIKMSALGPEEALEEGAYCVQLIYELFESLREHYDFGKRLFSPRDHEQLYRTKIHLEDISNMMGPVITRDSLRSLIAELHTYVNSLGQEEVNYGSVTEGEVYIKGGEVVDPCQDVEFADSFLFETGLMGVVDDQLSPASIKTFKELLFYLQTQKEYKRSRDSVYLDNNLAELKNVLARFRESLEEMNVLTAKAVAFGRMIPLIMVDAEQYDIQAMLDVMVRHECFRVNKVSCTLCNTYQMYLKAAATKLRGHLYIYNKLGIPMGAKIVRGAYLRRERIVAEKMKRECPVCPTIFDTHDSYNSSISIMVENAVNNHGRVMFGTHNSHSLKLLLDEMKKHEHDHLFGKVLAGQLYGMRDELTTALSHTAVTACKYVPYGPMNLVIPYLIRRCQENADIFGHARQDIHWYIANLVEKMKYSVG